MISVDQSKMKHSNPRSAWALFAFVLLLVFQTLQQSPTEDEVHFPIPGYEGHKWYSGYLSFDTGKFHYMFFESQRDPNNDPVLLWLNGGPGCSSLIGMLYENGPFVFKAGTTQLNINEYAWNKKANVLYLESPGGVGFSHGNRDNLNTDETVAEDNLKALVEWYKRFPTYKKNDFYIAGESYAGVYVPYLSWEIVKYNKLAVKDITFPFKGFMVGNACTDPRECWEPGADANVSIYQYEYLYNHGFYTEEEFDEMKAVCWMGYKSEECGLVRERLDKKFAATNTSLLNIYKKCYYGDAQVTTDSTEGGEPKKKQYKYLQSGKKLDLADFVDCDDHLGIDHFLNEPAIHEYFHVDPVHYEMCSDIVAEHYTVGENQSYWLYPELMKEKLRIWVYSGDLDADVPITGTLTWLQRLREDHSIPIEEPWREWWIQGKHKHEDQVGGMSWTLKGLTFATVKGAGHMAPLDQREAGFTLVNSFLSGNELPFKDEVMEQSW